MPDLLSGLPHYCLFYNSEQRHQSFGYMKSDVSHLAGRGDTAKMSIHVETRTLTKKSWGSAKRALS